jgi:alpha-mannosidase
LNEGITTVGTVLDLMDEYPELTFLRGEAVIYQHIQKNSPRLFQRMRDRISEGRWDVVGGTYVQPDSNLSSTETLCRQFEISLPYFEKELGVRPTIAWQPDSFGHSGGWPHILRSFGMDGFAFTRPQRPQFTMRSAAFWWDGAHRDKLLCYRPHQDWYGCERAGMKRTLDDALAAARPLPLRNVGLFIGLGNHGGGPTRRHLREIELWKKAHPEIQVRFSTLHGFFDVLRTEIRALPVRQVSVVEGEFGYCLRGCYSSTQRFKAAYRQAEAGLVSAEITSSLIGPPHSRNLHEAWTSTLFNSFHDILPGSSIERAVEEQTAWIGAVGRDSQMAAFEALSHLAGQIDTRVPPPAGPDKPTRVPVLVWNPSERIFHGQVEVEAPLDYRPLWDYRNRAVPFGLWDAKRRSLPFQEIATEHSSLPGLPWRKRVLVTLTLPPFGWEVVTMGMTDRKEKPLPVQNPCRCSTKGPAWIGNADWRIAVSKSGKLSIAHGNKPFFLGGKPLELITVEDPFGSWGGMLEERESYCLDRVREKWKLTNHELLEKGPQRAVLWTRWEAGHSWLDLTFKLNHVDPWIAVQGRMLWNERSARLQLVLPSQGPATCDVPGGVAVRRSRGQVPVGRWFTRSNGRNSTVGVASDVLSDADFLPRETRLTLARATRYANDVVTAPGEKLWQPAVDCGELKFALALFTNGADPDHVAARLLRPPVTLSVPPGAGPLRKRGSLGSLTPNTLCLLSLCRPSGSRLRVRLQNRGKTTASAVLKMGTHRYPLGKIAPQQIITKSVALASRS